MHAPCFSKKTCAIAATGGGTVSRSTTFHIIRLCVLFVSIIIVGADLSVSAQNSNSSTTMPEDASMQNSNTSNMNSGNRGRRRGRRRGGNMNTAGAATQPVMTGRCDPMAQVQTDLSGTYTGTVDYAEGGLSGETTLTISGNNFTMTSGSTTQEGRLTAVTTCNYTAVTMMFGKEQVSAPTGPQPAPLPAVSLRARRIGTMLRLESVEGESRRFSFNSATPRFRRASTPGAPQPVGIKPPTLRNHAR
jgi:hypothetical protein